MFQFVLVTVQRMARDVKARVLLFPGQAFLIRRLGNIRQHQMHSLLQSLLAEESQLSTLVILLCLLSLGHGLIEHGQQLRAPRARTVESPALDEALDDAFVDHAHIDARAEVQQILERAAFPAHAHDIRQRVLAHVAHGREPEADGLAIDGEMCIAGVDIGRQDADVHTAAELDVVRHLLRIHDAREHSRHELGGIVRLEIGRLPGHQRVGRAVRLVEAVVREMREQVENRRGQSRRDMIGLAAVEEVLLLSHQDFSLFLAHGAAQQISLPEAEAREHLHDLHDLLLVEHDAEGLLEDGLKRRMQILHLFRTAAARDEVIHHARAQRSRTVERDGRDEVGEAGRRDVLDEVRHAARLHLEHRPRAPLAEHLARELV